MTNKLNGMQSRGIESLEGKLAVVLLVASLVIMMLNMACLPRAFANEQDCGQDGEPVAALVETAKDIVADQTPETPTYHGGIAR